MKPVYTQPKVVTFTDEQIREKIGPVQAVTGE